jgi:hypothetical protein
MAAGRTDSHASAATLARNDALGYSSKSKMLSPCCTKKGSPRRKAGAADILYTPYSILRRAEENMPLPSPALDQ